MKKIVGITVFLLLVILWIPLSYADDAFKNRANGEYYQIWEDFRNTFPYHVQLIGVSKALRDGYRMIILSEPPPYVTVNSLRKLFPRQINSAVKMEHPFGYDGWVKDLILIIDSLSEKKLNSLLRQLQLYIFNTTYKATIVNLPVSATKEALTANMNLLVSAEELYHWLINKREKLVLIDTGEMFNAQDLIENNRSGVYMSEKPGLSVWSIPLTKDLMDSIIEARQFAMDSDLILGAISKNNNLLIVGRERVLPLNILPPLRIETILQLAAVKSNDLLQSYERNHILAGKMANKKDWAPIFLSDQLIDTEYGSLLNLTDQLLKSWSMNGRVSYINFDYPDPGRWPFAKPLSDMMGATSVTFNWNTKGAGAMYNVSGYRIFSINRTGALPISYIPNEDPGKAEKYERIAYEYFSSVSDANLVRVVQYAALYSIFKNFNVKCTFRTNNERPHPEKTAVKKEMIQLFNKILMLKKEEINNIVAVYIGKNRKAFKEYLEKYGDDSDLNNVFSSIVERIEVVAGALELIHEKYGEAGIDLLIEYLVNREKFRSLLDVIDGRIPESTLSDADLGVGPIALYLMKEKLIKTVSGLMVDKTQAKNRYVKAYKQRNVGWIQTASIVLSADENETYTGGHNLYSKVPKFRVGSDVRPGQVKVIEEGGDKYILLNRKDLGKIEKLKWITGRYADDPKLAQVLNDSLVKIAAPNIRTKATALELPPRIGSNRSNLYRNASYFSSDARYTRKIGYALTDAKPAVKMPHFIDDAAIQSLPSRSTLKIERLQGNMYSVRANYSKLSLEASGMDNLVESCARRMNKLPHKNDSLNMVLTDFTYGEAKGFIKNFEMAAYRREQILKETSLKGQTGVKGFLKRIKWYISSNFLPKHAYNFAKAEIKAKPIETVITGGFKVRQKMTYEISIPCELRTPRVFNVSLLFKRMMFTKNLDSEIRHTVHGSVVNAKIIEDIPKQIKSRLSKYTDNIEFIYKEESTDVYYLKLDFLKKDQFCA